MSLDESSVIGRISKQWIGFEAEAFTDADNFGLQFPMELDVKIKAVILGACFLIVSNRCSSLIIFLHDVLAFLSNFKNRSNSK